MDSAKLEPPLTGAASGVAALVRDPVQQEDDLQIQSPVAVAEPDGRAAAAASSSAMIVLEQVTKVYEPDVVALRDV